jgi:FKBP-type peptidyl-prolyl cis-trans isomerase 2
MRKLAYCSFALFASALLLAGCGKSNIVKLGDTISIDFTSSFSDGTIFESGSMSFTVGSGEFIKGVEDGVLGMKAKETKKMTITPDIGYGTLYDQNKIQKISKLIFDKTDIKAESGAEADL